MTETTIITTQIRSDSDDFDIRQEFCGFQDKRLNDLRQFTSCIIDLQTHGTKDPFEKVTWIISHFDERVRTFVIKRIQAWAQTTQIAAHMHSDDINFYQHFLSDSSSSSIDVKIQQLGNSLKLSPSPPKNSIPIMFNKNCKTPLHDYHCGSAPNAALVPQTDIQQRYQQRRRRNSSSSSSGTRRPALFGKPSDYFLSKNRYSPLSIPITNIQTNESQSLFSKSSQMEIKKPSSSEISFTNINENANKENNAENEEWENELLEQEAKWANLLSDTSDFESDCQPLMGDIILISQLRDCLINSQITSNDSIEYIRSQINQPLSIVDHGKLKTLNNEFIWFYRILLNSKIILSDGLHKSKEKAQKLAYKKMVELITAKQGIEPKIISNGRCKVVLRKVISSKNINETTIIDSTINDTTIDY